MTYAPLPLYYMRIAWQGYRTTAVNIRMVVLVFQTTWTTCPRLLVVNWQTRKVGMEPHSTSALKCCKDLEVFKQTWTHLVECEVGTHEGNDPQMKFKCLFSAVPYDLMPFLQRQPRKKAPIQLLSGSNPSVYGIFYTPSLQSGQRQACVTGKNEKLLTGSSSFF